MKPGYITSLISFVLTVTLLTITQTHLHAHTQTSLFASAQASKQNYGIRLNAPDIAENGAVVSVNVDMFGLDSESLYVKKLQLFVCHMGFRPIQTMEFHRPVKFYKTRIKLNKTDKIFALATLNTGEFVHASHTSKVTIGGCGGGGGYSAPPIADASTPSDAISQHTRTWVKSTLPYNATRLITNNNQWLELKSMRTDVKINGFRARVMLNMEFYNPFKRQNEGRFQLRLPESATPYYVAFGDVVYMNKEESLQHLPSETSGFTKQELSFDRYQHQAKLKEAVMVPRKQARDAYQTIVGNRRDPALVEWQGNGVYSVNVFPLQAYAMHRVVLAYDMELPVVNGKLEYLFKAPANDVPTDVYVHIDKNTTDLIDNLNAKPVLVSRNDPRLFHFKPGKGEEIKFQFTNTHERMLYGKDKATGNYFAFKHKLSLPSSFAENSRSYAVFALDTSATSYGNNFSEQVNLLHALLEANHDDIKHFAVLYFDVGTHWWLPYFVRNTEKSRNALKNSISRINLAGATDLHRALIEIGKPHWLEQQEVDLATQWDVFLLTDGRATWGDTRPQSLVNALKKSDHIGRLFAYVNQRTNTDRDLLDLLSHETYGAVFDLPIHTNQKALATDPIVYAHRMTNWRVLSAQAEDGDDIFLANANFYAYNNQELTIVGRGQPQKTIELTLENDHQTRSLHIQVPRTKINTSLAPRIYAEAAVRKLEDYSDDHTDLALMYATHFRIPRQTVSLLMLETQKDYDRFKINNHVNYAHQVMQQPVAGVIANLTPPETTRYEYTLPPIASNQLETIAQYMTDYSVCRLPDHYLAELNLSHLATKAAIKHKPMQLDRGVYHNYYRGYGRFYGGYSDHQADAILELGSDLIARNNKTAGLRAMSSVMEFENTNIATRIKLTKQLLKHGFGNEGYYLMNMYPSVYSSGDGFDLLIQSVEQENEIEYAQALQTLRKHELNVNKQALEP